MGFIGGTYIGGSYIGSLRLGPKHTAITTFTDLFATRSEQLTQPSPLIELYELETEQGNFVRVVDFADPKNTAPVGQISFNGSNFESIKIGRGDVEDSAEGTLPRFVLTVADPDRSKRQFVRDNGNLEGAVVRMWRTFYDYIDQPEIAASATFRVKRGAFLEGPARVAIEVGPPTLRDMAFPLIPFSRTRCHADFPRRHIHDGYNECNYPSDEFEAQSAQFLKTSADTETEKEQGWYVLNGSTPAYRYLEAGYPGPMTDGVGSFTNEQGSDKALACSVATADIRWKDGVKNGPFIYKKIGTTSGEVRSLDLYMKFQLSTLTDKDDYLVGILVQSQVNANDWVFWGIREVSAAFKWTMRKNISTTSTDYDTTYVTGNAVRLTRSGDVWTGYTRSEDLSKVEYPTTAWTQQEQQTFNDIFQSDPALNVGLVFASDSTASADDLVANIYHCRFSQGGYQTCPRDLDGCEIRKNGVQFQGRLGLPTR